MGKGRGKHWLVSGKPFTGEIFLKKRRHHVISSFKKVCNHHLSERPSQPSLSYSLFRLVSCHVPVIASVIEDSNGLVKMGTDEYFFTFGQESSEVGIEKDTWEYR